MAAKTKGIGQGVIYSHLARYARYIIKIHAFIGVFKIDSRRSDRVFYRQRRGYGFNAAGSAQKVSGHGFYRTDGKFFGVFAKYPLDS